MVVSACLARAVLKKGGNLSMPGMCCGKKVSFSISEIGHHKKVNFSMDGIGWWSKG
jgi:hypothetical protein